MRRFIVQELRLEKGFLSIVSSACKIPQSKVAEQLRFLNSRIKRHLDLEDSPFEITLDGSLKTSGIAGLVRLNQEVEIEIVPKFLNPDSSEWREDFLFLAVLLHTGKILPKEKINTNFQDQHALTSLLAHSLLNLYSKNARHPIRSYRRTINRDFSFDGSVDWESLIFPAPEGFANSRLELSRQNVYNATILKAFQILAADAIDSGTETRLRAVIRYLAPQPKPPSAFPPLPPRNAAWQDTYCLAQMVVSGMSFDFREGDSFGLGFVISTWSAWEALCLEAFKRALPDYSVFGQYLWPLGNRKGKRISAKPDISVIHSSKALFLADAKYKTRREKRTSINRADLYESLAFLQASGTNYLMLLYPSQQPPSISQLGQLTKIDGISVGSNLIEGFELQIQGISRKGGFKVLVTRLQKQLRFLLLLNLVKIYPILFSQLRDTLSLPFVIAILGRPGTVTAFD